MAKKPVLVVMAAGMGSRYGGLKQIDPVGSHGEAILDYSLYDAHEAGFETAVIIIKKAIEKGKHVLCESPLTLSVKQSEELLAYSREKNIIFMEAIKTAEMAKVLKAVNAEKALIVTAEKNENVYKSARNIKDVKATFVNEMNVYEILKHDVMVVTKDAVKKIEEVYA